ncbi:MAG TPA: CHAD domain-containing protein [Blastocatellia bacterium]|nr:CHAD domain-containing protein [Blastocatellia bacterium]
MALSQADTEDSESADDPAKPVEWVAAVVEVPPEAVPEEAGSGHKSGSLVELDLQGASENGAESSTPTSPDASNRTSVDVVPSQRAVSLGDILLNQLEALQKHHHHVLETGDVEAVHKLRTTTRRLQAGLDLLKARSDDLNLADIKQQLRKWRKALAKVRNHDVFISMVEGDTTARNNVLKQQNETVASELKRLRARQFGKLKRKLKHLSVKDIIDRLGLNVSSKAAGMAGEGAGDVAVDGVGEGTTARLTPSYTGVLDSSNADDKAMRARAAERLRRRTEEFYRLAARVQPTDSPTEVHRLRIAAKRLRYLLEILSHLGYGDANRATGWLKVVQDRLGDLHDIDAFKEEVVKVVSQPRFITRHLAEGGGMLYAAARLESRKTSLVSKIFPLRIPPAVGSTSRRMERALLARPRTSRRATAWGAGTDVLLDALPGSSIVLETNLETRPDDQ